MPRTMAVARRGRPALVGADESPGARVPVSRVTLRWWLSASLGTSLAVDAGLGVGQRLEALEVDAPTGGEAQAVGATGDALERAVDLVDDLLRRRRQEQVALALDVDG